MKACAVITALLFTGCMSPHQAVVTDVNALAWCDSAAVAIRNNDTLAMRELRILVRSNEAFDGDTLTLRIATLSPDSLRYEESLTIRIPHPPKAASLRREADVLYRRDVVLADTGIYRFTFTPTRPVRGVESVGIHIVNN